jgi:hypothetical protein
MLDSNNRDGMRSNTNPCTYRAGCEPERVLAQQQLEGICLSIRTPRPRESHGRTLKRCQGIETAPGRPRRRYRLQTLTLHAVPLCKHMLGGACVVDVCTALAGQHASAAGSLQLQYIPLPTGGAWGRGPRLHRPSVALERTRQKHTHARASHRGPGYKT